MDIAPLLSAKLPKLTHLALANCEQQDELAKLVLASKLLPQLRSLDLSRGSLDDAGAQLLAGARGALTHLAVLDVSDNYLTKAGVELVKGLAKRVLVDEQREPYDWDETKRRYASVGE